MDEKLTKEELFMFSSLANKQVKLSVSLMELEELVDRTKKELNDVRDRDLPNAMAEVGISSFTTESGFKISIGTEVYASITEEKAPIAFAWLREKGHGAIIKNQIIAEFGKGEDEKAIEAAMLLAEAGYKPKQKEAVHPQTLKAFLKEQINKGNDVPLEAFSAFVVNRAKVEKK